MAETRNRECTSKQVNRRAGCSSLSALAQIDLLVRNAPSSSRCRGKRLQPPQMGNNHWYLVRMRNSLPARQTLYKVTQNPVANLGSVPAQKNSNFGLSLDDSGAWVVRLLYQPPLVRFWDDTDLFGDPRREPYVPLVDRLCSTDPQLLT